MLNYKIYSTEDCKAFIKRNKKGQLEFKHEECPRVITMSKNLEAYLKEFKADPKRYNYLLPEIKYVLDRINKLIKGNIDINFSIFLLPEAISIVNAITCMEKGKNALVIFAKITPKSSGEIPWLLSHEIGHFIQNYLVGVIEDPSKVWEDREHEKFANLFADMIMKRWNNVQTLS